MTFYSQAVSEDLLSALRALMADPQLDAFYLVGGTSLALRFAHRTSVDIDLFIDKDFDSKRLAEHMDRRHNLQNIEMAPNTVRGWLNGVKLDMIAHLYPPLHPADHLDGIRLLSLPDIAAMKLNAISNRGSKKDFWDYALLLDHYRHGEMLDYFSRKYAMFNRWHVEKSVLYFEDAETEPDPVDLLGKTWDDVKTKILTCCRE